jgi:carbonic anhydrase
MFRFGYNDFDLICLRGGSKAVIDESSRGAIFESIDAAIRLHGVKRVIIVDHIDCGAYGGSNIFANCSEEESFHLTRLNEATSIIRAVYPSLEVVSVYLDWEALHTL